MMTEIEKMKQEIKKMRAEIEERRQERVAKGLPPDPPAPFLPIAFSAVLADQIEPVLPFLVKYAQLVQKAGKTLPVDTTKLQPYKEKSELLSRSKGQWSHVYGGFIKIAIADVEKASRGEISGSTAARYIYTIVSFIKDLRPSTDFYDTEDRDAAYDEYRRLKDDTTLFEAELEKHREYYKSIKHLY